jgi:hypothetical protein
MNIAVLVFAGLLLTSTAQAGINPGLSGGILSSKERCAAALNNYLSYRQTAHTENASKIQKLENQVDALCEGYQIQLMENNGITTGMIELAD